VRQRQRPREYLTEREIGRLMKAAGDNRWGHRDATAILIAYRHGLRASELVAVRGFCYFGSGFLAHSRIVLPYGGPRSLQFSGLPAATSTSPIFS